VAEEKAADGRSVTSAFSPQCSKPYAWLNGTWRADSNDAHGPPCPGKRTPTNPCTGHKGMGDVKRGYARCITQHFTATGVGDNRWYRFAEAAADALALYARGDQHCGTYNPGYLSGWNVSSDGVGTGCNPGTPGGSSTGPPCDYGSPGQYPTAAAGGWI